MSSGPFAIGFEVLSSQFTTLVLVRKRHGPHLHRRGTLPATALIQDVVVIIEQEEEYNSPHTSSISCPNKEGWVAEFEDARRSVRESKSSKDCSAHLRLAIAARTLRQWEICQEASSSGLKLACTQSDDDSESFNARKASRASNTSQKSARRQKSRGR
jgi:hypothetical protein